jgi:predicted CoA-binding protein
VTEEAIAIGAKVIWMQLQIVNHQAAQMAESTGIKVVMDRCPKLELQKTYWTDRET